MRAHTSRSRETATGDEASPKPLGSGTACPCPATAQAQRCGQSDLVRGDTGSYLHPVLRGRHGSAQLPQPRPNHALPPHPSPTSPSPHRVSGQIQDFRTSASRAKRKVERGRNGTGCPQGAPYVPPPGQRGGSSWVLPRQSPRPLPLRQSRPAAPRAAPPCHQGGAHVPSPGLGLSGVRAPAPPPPG